jgi:hypothetical protein
MHMHALHSNRKCQVPRGASEDASGATRVGRGSYGCELLPRQRLGVHHAAALLKQRRGTTATGPGHRYLIVHTAK